MMRQKQLNSQTSGIKMLNSAFTMVLKTAYKAQNTRGANLHLVRGGRRVPEQNRLPLIAQALLHQTECVICRTFSSPTLFWCCPPTYFFFFFEHFSLKCICMRRRSAHCVSPCARCSLKLRLYAGLDYLHLKQAWTV